jgi:hypothetical protein
LAVSREEEGCTRDWGEAEKIGETRDDGFNSTHMDMCHEEEPRDASMRSTRGKPSFSFHAPGDAPCSIQNTGVDIMHVVLASFRSI